MFLLYGSLYKDFIEPGDVNLVFRDYPLSIHPHAIDAAKAAECADDQGKFREMFAYLFENSDSLKSGGPLEWAEETQLDLEQFSVCMADEATELEIEKNNRRRAS